MNAKVKKQTTRRFRFDRLITSVFVLSMIAYLCTSLMLKAYNVSLLAQTRNNENQIVQLQAEVDSITMEVKDLSDYNRVIKIIDGSSMGSANTQVISILD